MKHKKLVLIAVILSVFLMAPIVYAQPPQKLTIWTDKPDYAPGETGTLYFTFYNDGSTNLTIKKITIVFMNWRAYRNNQWEGNVTIEPSSPLEVAGYGTYDNSTKFTVPTDGRAKTTDVEVKVQTTEFGEIPQTYQSISVVQTPKYMEQIVFLLTIFVILVMVCTAIIAATIFLSSRRPQVTWRTEEKQ